MKKLFLILCVVGSFAIVACDDTKDCSCNVQIKIPELSLVQTMKYQMLGYEGECSEINAETLGLSMQVENSNAQFEVKCEEK
ncbi:MAG: hypothetical protein LBR17_00160 [Bacteroidales bacterium]|jgi:hypothetical protein|nr:hypothetical protein [Bacteroidales bacterium]